jgi:hypothetical protein
LRLQPPPSRRGEEGKLPWKKKRIELHIFLFRSFLMERAHTHSTERWKANQVERPTQSIL